MFLANFSYQVATVLSLFHRPEADLAREELLAEQAARHSEVSRRAEECEQRRLTAGLGLTFYAWRTFQFQFLISLIAFSSSFIYLSFCIQGMSCRFHSSHRLQFHICFHHFFKAPGSCR